MIKFRYIVLVCLLCLAPQLFAQTYDVVERRNFWNRGANAAGIRMDSVTISYAELHANTMQGGFHDLSEAENPWSAGAVAKTIVHTAKYSMKGSFRFDHTQGDGMCGSMFIHPGFYPFDLLESTPGSKTLQNYAFTGAISGDVAPRWRIGAEVDFASANYSKRKDPRHTNSRLDLKVAPGVMYHSGNFAVGLSYRFGKNSESVKARIVGPDDDSYMVFLDKGLMYGAEEKWDGAGVHLTESGINGFPVKEISHGVAAQLQWGGFYGDAEYRYGDGTAGEKQIVWFKFPSHSLSSHLGYKIVRSRVAHFFRLDIGWMNQVSDESVWKERSNNGVDIPEIDGYDRIFERETLTFEPQYEIISPRGELRVGAVISSIKRLSTQAYPEFTRESMTCYRVGFDGTLHAGRFDVKLAAAFASGSFTEELGSVDPSVEVENTPARKTEYYNLQNEYLTASRIALDAAVRYNFPKGFYAQVGAGFIHGFDLKYISGANRWSETLKLGYTF